MNKNLNPISELPPFLKFCYTVGMLPTSYKISMTYEEQVLEAIRFIKEEIIPKVNSNALATKELQEKFVELVNYVETYFDNLDVQDEVNNKLNEMVEDGTLAEIINQEIFSEINQKILINENSINDLENYKNANLQVIPIYTGENISSGTVVKIQNKLILVDFGLEANSTNIINFLVTNNFTKFDYAIITHFDTDHIGNVTGLKHIINSNLLDFSDCTFIYHKKLDDNLTAKDYKNFYDEVDKFIRYTKGYTVLNPTNEGQEIIIDNFAKLNFYNCNENFYPEYYESKIYNNFSLITLISLNDYKILLTGDSEKICEENYAPELPYNINVVSVPHHGVNQITSNELMKRIAHDGIYYIINSRLTPLNRPYLQQALNTGARLYTTNESHEINIEIKNNILSSYCTGQAITKFNYNSEIKENTDLNTLTFLDNYTCTDSSIINTLQNMPLNYGNTEYKNQFYIKNIRIGTNAIYQFFFAVNSLVEPYMRKTTDGTTWTPWCQIKTVPNFVGTYRNNAVMQLTACTWATILSVTKSMSKWSAPIELGTDGIIKINNNTNTQARLHLTGQISFTDTTVNDRINIAVFKNGNEDGGNRFESYISKATTNSNNTFTTYTFDFLVSVTTNDQIELKIRNVTNACSVRSGETKVNVEMI